MEFEDDLEHGAVSLWEPSDPAAVVRRVWCGLAIVGVSMAVVAFVVFDQRDAVGVVAGAALVSLSFWFLQSSLRSLLLSGDEQPPSGTVLMFVVRWFLVGSAGYAAYRTGLASGGGILVGTFALLGAVMLEALFQALSSVVRLGGGNS